MEDALEHTRDIFGKLPSCSLKIPGYPHQAFYVLSLFHQQTGREENRKSRKPEEQETGSLAEQSIITERREGKKNEKRFDRACIYSG